MRYWSFAVAVFSLWLDVPIRSTTNQQGKFLDRAEVVEPVLANDPRFPDPAVGEADIAGVYKKFCL
jgi:hypothetical protein